MKLKVGDKAPNFQVLVGHKAVRSLKHYDGKFLILYFYPKDDTPGCTIETRDFDELIPEFDKINTRVLGISKDSIDSHDKFCIKYAMQIELGSDMEGEVCKAYGVWGEKSMFGKKYFGINRATFLIDPNGTIAHIWSKVSVKGHASEVYEKIESLQMA
ncbi:MAG: peroxiredoxin [Rickettsiaceae bacterium]|nr:peroxiredoxin [Rickettsiaceae bacterium]